MSSDLAQALQAALDDGCSLAELEATLLADGDSDDQIAAAWLYAWAYDAIRPRHDELAARNTSGAGLRCELKAKGWGPLRSVPTPERWEARGVTAR